MSIQFKEETLKHHLYLKFLKNKNAAKNQKGY